MENLKELEAALNGLGKQMNDLVDPLIKRLENVEKEPESVKTELKAELKKANDALVEMQKQYDALDMRLQKAQDNPIIYDLNTEVGKIVGGAEWLKNMKSTKRGGTLSFSGLDLMNTKAVVTRVADTIPVQFTPFQYVPGQRFHVRNILPVGTTTAPYVWMPYESATTNGIARVAESGYKPNSDFTPAVTKWTIEKIATHLKFSDELLEDMPQITSYITTRWLELLKQKEDYYLLYGSGSSQPKGLTVSGTAYSDPWATSNINRFMVLDAAVTQVKTAGFTPNYILLHPNDALKLRHEIVSSGDYIFSQAGMAGAPVNIGGAQVIETPAMTEGDFLTGDFAMGAQIWDKKAASITFYDQNEDDALYNRVTAVLEERLALVTYQSTAFVFGVMASALARGSA